MKAPASVLADADKELIADLYQRFGKKLYGYAVTKWNTGEDTAWDLVYKTLFQFMKVRDRYTFENSEKEGAFVFRVFMNFLRNHYRDTRQEREMTVLLPEGYENFLKNPEDSPESKKKSPVMICLEKVLQVMEGWQRILLLMRAQDFAYEDIAPYTDKTPDNLRVYYLRLKKVVAEKTNECLEGKRI